MKEFLKDMSSMTCAFITIMCIGALFGTGFGIGFCYVVKDKIVAIVPVSEIRK